MVPFLLSRVKDTMPLPHPDTIVPPSAPAVTRGKFFLYLFLVLFFGLAWLSNQPRVQATILEWNQHPLWYNITRLVVGGDKLLNGESDGRVNFLLLGEGGVPHDGPYLTDTIMVASLKPETGQVALVSIPRDLIVNLGKLGWQKINAANAFGEQNGPGQGAVLASQVIGQMLDIPIHYYVRVNFDGFANMVDQLGGLPIEVQNAFVDHQYPTDNNGYTTINFEAGNQVMTGARALEFVRSRHASGTEGSDFARARRQQQVLVALKNKLLSPSTYLNPTLVIRLYRTFSQSVETNLSAGEAVRLANILRTVDTQNIITRTFDNTPTGLLHESVGSNGAYILLPNKPDYSELKNTLASIFTEPKLASEAAMVVLENGTTITGLAQTAAANLSTAGVTVREVKNAAEPHYANTIVYDYSNNTKPSTRKILETLFRTTAVQPDKSDQSVTPPADFLIILGADWQAPKG